MKRKERRVRFTAFEGLSDEGKGVILLGLREDWTQRRMQEELQVKTREKISNGSIGRFVEWWRRQDQHEKTLRVMAQRMIDGVQKGGVKATDQAEALLCQSLLENVDEAGNLDLETSIRFQKQYHEMRQKERAADRADKRKAEEIEIQREKLGVLKEQARLQRERLEIFKSGIKKVSTAVKSAEEKVAKGQQLTLEDFNKIRDVYGLEHLTEVAASAA